ncbi:hypothetical protein SO802_013745 [Lithocarpus litseifolius]|uniref:Uncharacterized protein n=1 Tax=Lithocarpus litseifolius TaxID=425828 RepID=A0AAW2D7X1_9ROSI
MVIPCTFGDGNKALHILPFVIGCYAWTSKIVIISPTGVKSPWITRFNEMDPSISGWGAEPTYRDKKGERISKEEFLKLRKKVKVEEKPKEIKLELGKGLAQKPEAEARLQELESEKDKPFARTRDDPELDKMLRERIRDGDPMAHLAKARFEKGLFKRMNEKRATKTKAYLWSVFDM